jgi:hypothetical protein
MRVKVAVSSGPIWSRQLSRPYSGKDGPIVLTASVGVFSRREKRVTPHVIEAAGYSAQILKIVRLIEWSPVLVNGEYPVGMLPDPPCEPFLQCVRASYLFCLLGAISL